MTITAPVNEPDARLSSVAPRSCSSVANGSTRAPGPPSPRSTRPPSRRSATSPTAATKTSTGPSPPPARPSKGPGRTMTPSERGRTLWRLADLMEQHADELAELEALDNGKPFAIAKARGRRPGRRPVPLHGRLGHEDRGQHHSDLGALRPRCAVPRLHPSGAGRRRGPDHPLELPAPHGRLEARAVPDHRLHRRPQAGRADSRCPRCGWASWPSRPGCPTACSTSSPASVTPAPPWPPIPASTRSPSPARPRSGKLVVQAATGNLKKVSLELGGKAPVVVYDDADLDAAIAGVANAIFFNTGQCCTAGSRLYIEETVFDDVVAGVAEAARGIKVGNAFEADSQSSAPSSPPSSSPGSRLPRIRGQPTAPRPSSAAGGRATRVSSWSPRCSRTSPGHEGRPGGDLRPGGRRASLQAGRPSPWPRPTTPTTASPPPCSPGTSARRTRPPPPSRRARCGSTRTTSTTRPLPFGGYKESGWGREMGHEVLENYLETKTVIIGL